MSTWLFFGLLIVGSSAIWTFFDAARLRDSHHTGIGPLGQPAQMWAALVFLLWPAAFPYYLSKREITEALERRPGPPPRFVTEGLNSFAVIVGLLGFGVFGLLLAAGKLKLSVIGLVVVAAGIFGGRKTHMTREQEKVELGSIAFDQVGFKPPETDDDLDPREEAPADLEKYFSSMRQVVPRDRPEPPTTPAPGAGSSPVESLPSYQNPPPVHPASTPAPDAPAPGVPYEPAPGVPYEPSFGAPVAPQSAAPQPVSPQPAAPQPTAHQPAASQPTAPRPVQAPITDEPAPGMPYVPPLPPSPPPVTPEPVVTRPATPQPVVPQPAAPRPAAPHRPVVARATATPSLEHRSPATRPPATTQATPATGLPGQDSAAPDLRSARSTEQGAAPRPLHEPLIPPDIPAARSAPQPPAARQRPVKTPNRPARQGRPAGPRPKVKGSANPYGYAVQKKQSGLSPWLGGLIGIALGVIIWAAWTQWGPAESSLENPPEQVPTQAQGSGETAPSPAETAPQPRAVPPRGQVQPPPNAATVPANRLGATPDKRGDGAQAEVDPEAMEQWTRDYDELMQPLAQLMDEIDFDGIDQPRCVELQSRLQAAIGGMDECPDPDVEQFLEPAFSLLHDVAQACRAQDEKRWSQGLLETKRLTHRAQELLDQRYRYAGITELELESAIGVERSPESISGRYLEQQRNDDSFGDDSAGDGAPGLDPRFHG